ncbi:MAG: entericidin [Planctomycetota bacterium]
MVSFRESVGRRFILILALAFLTFSLIGCQTVKGLGKDITTAGEVGENILEKP